MKSIFAFFGIAFAALSQNVLATQKDELNQAVAPERIVASGGSITEIIFALGEAHRLVGVDSTSVYPKEATELPQIGYVRNLSPEGVLSLRPDLLLGEADTGPVKVVEQLKTAGLTMQILQGQDSFFDIEKKVRIIAATLKAEDKGEALVTSILQAREQRETLLAHVTKKPKVLFVLGMRSGQPIVAGKDTSANEIIEAAGAINIAANAFSGWKPLSPEAAVALAPEVILGMARHDTETKIDLSKMSHFAMSPAVQNQRVYVFDGNYLLGMGPRTPTAVVELIRVLYPQLTSVVSR
ncbi:Periplasmic hemin-binding protein [Pseudoalteromonas luteoviolacea B = ATCC 29581]|nr:Periplasmic hemin-binding protein [Pseudoalteromonas luteoviolacea B = ATCC 29581]